MTANTQNTTIVSQPCCSLLWSTAALDTEANRWQLPKGTTRFHTVARKLSMKIHCTRTKATRWQLQNSTFFIPVAWKLSMKHRYTRTKANRWQLQSVAWKLSVKHYYTRTKANRWQLQSLAWKLWNTTTLEPKQPVDYFKKTLFHTACVDASELCFLGKVAGCFVLWRDTGYRSRYSWKQGDC